jgi:Ni,Fe-hydrogenase I small subunit
MIKILHSVMSKPVPADPELYARIKAKIKRESKSRWPSAYLSGHLVKTYKAAMEKRGKKAYKVGSPSKKSSSLKRWYDEKWIDVKTGKPCGSVKTKTYYPTCRPRKKITEDTPRTARSLSIETKKKMIKLKQTAKGKTVHYSYKK